MDGRDKQDGIEYASAWRRLIAGLVDWACAVVIGLGVGFIAGFATCTGVVMFGDPFVQNMIGLAPFVFPILTIPIIALIAQIKYAIGVADSGETPGHGRVSIHVIRENGEELSRRHAVLRQFAGSPMLTIPFLAVVVALILPLAGELQDWLYGSSDHVDALRSFLGNWLFERVWFVPLLLAIANHIWMAIDRKGRGWHDLIFGTVAVRYY